MEILLESVGYNAGCWLTKMEHCNRNHFHFAASPLKFSKNASRGFTTEGGLGAVLTGVVNWAHTVSYGIKWRPCKVLISSSVREVRWLTWWRWVVSWLAWADNSDENCMMAAGSLCGELFCNEESMEWGSICSCIDNMISMLQGKGRAKVWGRQLTSTVQRTGNTSGQAAENQRWGNSPRTNTEW